MRAHHTKDKGDLGVLHAKVDLAEKGYFLLQPLTEHAPFDLVVYKDERFLRVQVKYRAVVRGSIILNLRSAWADRHGTHMVPMDKSAIDLLCIYCPDTRTCYYADPLEFDTSVSLRITPPRNGQVKNIRLASNYTEIPERLRGLPEGAANGVEPGRIVGQSS
jgi:hypothetical protein